MKSQNLKLKKLIISVFELQQSYQEERFETERLLNVRRSLAMLLGTKDWQETANKIYEMKMDARRVAT